MLAVYKVHDFCLCASGAMYHTVYVAKILAEKYPESFDAAVPSELVYSGTMNLLDKVEGTPLDAGKLVLSPTRTYAPVIKKLLDTMRSDIHGMVHCSGGAQTKVMHFVDIAAFYVGVVNDICSFHAACYSTVDNYGAYEVSDIGLIMNIDDLLCVGATDNILVSSTIGRNKMLIPGEVIAKPLSTFFMALCTSSFDADTPRRSYL